MPCITPLVEPVAHPRAQEHPPRNHHPHVHSLTCPQDIGPPIKIFGQTQRHDDAAHLQSIAAEQDLQSRVR